MSRITRDRRQVILPRHSVGQPPVLADGNRDPATFPAARRVALLRYEAPFWLLMVFWSFCPATMTPWVRCHGLPLDTKDIAMVAAAIGYGCLALLHSRQRAKRDRYDYRRLPLFFAVLLLYAWCSMFWSGADPVHQSGVFWTLVITLASWLLPWAFLTRHSPTETQGLLIRLTLCLALVSLVYGSESVLRLGLRATEREMQFGITRMYGPLFNAATGYFILLPALGCGLQEWLNSTHREGITVTLLVAFLLTAGTVALGSRGGMIGFAAFLWFTVLFAKGAHKTQVVLLLVLFAAGGVGILLLADADFDRVAILDDNYRRTTHETAANIIAHGSLPEVVRGAGYGAYWPWYSRCGWTPESCEEPPPHYIPLLVETDYGPILFNPHSDLLLLTVELGLPGLAFFVTLWCVLVGLAVKHGTDRRVGLLCCALAASGVAMFCAGPLFATARTSSVWWLFLFGALKTVGTGYPQCTWPQTRDARRQRTASDGVQATFSTRGRR